MFQKFRTLVERQFNTKIKSIQFDWGGEFHSMSPILSNLGSSHRISCPHTHEQQGKVERKHQHIVETRLSLLAHNSTPARYMHFLFESTVYLINQLPSSATNGLFPYELVHHSIPDYDFLKTSSCLCYL